jgi:hypothetical protein
MMTSNDCAGFSIGIGGNGLAVRFANTQNSMAASDCLLPESMPVAWIADVSTCATSSKDYLPII